MSFPYALELVDVVKRFGDHTAVDNVSFTVETGTIMALLGPNGAGKTTTIEMCEGFQRPDSGKISVLGMSPAAEPDKVRAQVGIMLQDSGSYSGIRVREMLELTASYSRDPLKPEWLLELFGLQNVQRTTYRRLSGGQKQRLNLAVALISRPRLVFVDEPTAGMDAQSRLLVWDLLRALRSDGVTVILTTHLMDEAQALADRVTIVDRGRVVAQGAGGHRHHDPFRNRWGCGLVPGRVAEVGGVGHETPHLRVAHHTPAGGRRKAGAAGRGGWGTHHPP